MEWMLDIQLGRRNLSPIQRIAVAEKYRPIYERQALANKQAAMQEARKNNEKNKSEQFSENSSTTVNDNKIDVRAKLAKTAGVSTDTYSKGKKILDSNEREIKDLIEINIRQRSICNPNPMKLGRCIKELEIIYNIKQGGSGYYGNQYEESRNNFVTPKTESDLAKEIGVDVRTLQNYKKFTEMIPELQDWVETEMYIPISKKMMEYLGKICTFIIEC